MTNDEIRRKIHDVIDNVDGVIDAIRRANDQMRVANDAMREAIERHDNAIVSALLANRAAMQLLEHLETGGV